MIRSLWTSATGMQAQVLHLDVISNNLANVGPAGFKKSRAEFQDLLYETLRPAGTPSSQDTQVPTGIQLGHGTRPSTVLKIFSQGDLEHTKNELDLAIESDGFFQITMPNGETAFTRDGGFKLDSEGRIVNADGFALEPEISIPTDAVSISVGMDGTDRTLDRILLRRLTSVVSPHFIAPSPDGPPPQAGPWAPSRHAVPAEARS